MAAAEGIPYDVAGNVTFLGLEFLPTMVDYDKISTS